MSANPYTIMFGKEPAQMISRISQSEQIVSTFLSDPAPTQIYMVTGVRGAGKTVLMTEIKNRFREEKDWIVEELNPATDLLNSLAAKLYSRKNLRPVFQSAKLNLSFFGIGIETGGGEPITDIEVALSQMMHALAKKGKRILITIDEAANTKEMRIFASAFQIFVRDNLPLYLLMTGLYENIDALQNNKILTFLHRAPKIPLGGLNLGSIERNYRKNFELSEEDARTMAHLTGGYPFAFQVLGYFTYEHHGDYQAAVEPTREYLDAYVYEKLWSELSQNDRRILYALAQSTKGKIAEIKEQTGMNDNELSTYRTRLINKGVVKSEGHGYLSFTLPFFDDFVQSNYIP